MRGNLDKKRLLLEELSHTIDALIGLHEIIDEHYSEPDNPTVHVYPVPLGESKRVYYRIDLDRFLLNTDVVHDEETMDDALERIKLEYQVFQD